MNETKHCSTKSALKRVSDWVLRLVMQRKFMRDLIRTIENKGYSFELFSKGLGWLEISALNEHMEKVVILTVSPHESVEKRMHLLIKNLA